MQQGRKMQPVCVDAFFRKDGQVLPRRFQWTSEKWYNIKILDITKGAALKRMGCGTRYHIHAGGKDSYLYRVSDLWFMAFTDDNGGVPEGHLLYAGEDTALVLDERYDNPYKAQVEVLARFEADRLAEPLYFIWDDGRRFPVEEILGVEKGHSDKAGIMGQRYDILCHQRKTALYRSDDLWFMERRGESKVLDVHGRPIGVM